MSFASIFLYLADISVLASQSEVVFGELILTVSCADFCFYQAYTELIELARQQPDTITLADFCGCLAGQFEKEYQADYEQATSIDYAMEFLCQDNYYTWQGKDITDIVNAYMVAK